MMCSPALYYMASPWSTTALLSIPPAQLDTISARVRSSSSASLGFLDNLPLGSRGQYSRLLRCSFTHSSRLNASQSELKRNEQAEHGHAEYGHSLGHSECRYSSGRPKGHDRKHLGKQNMFLKRLVGPEGFEPSTNGL